MYGNRRKKYQGILSVSYELGDDLTSQFPFKYSPIENEKLPDKKDDILRSKGLTDYMESSSLWYSSKKN